MTRGPSSPPLATAAYSAPERDSAVDTARYIADLSAELARIAADAHLDLLAHFLSMARLEAETAARRAANAPET
jgi:hypothetical protein